ncbi:39S ribosomal protein L24, mitochondrial, partial [Sticta canariensis]|nr:39S ribosomal protein L24, mitochondrial [Sticta canariensis]
TTSIKTLTRARGPAPTYPYPARTTYKQSNHGLYGGTHIQYGNNVAVKKVLGKNRETKTRRLWRPNIQTQHLWSAALGRLVRVRLQARVLRTIDKLGGLDEYVLGNKAQRIKELGAAGWELRWSIINTKKVRERFRRERKKLGLPNLGLEARLQLREECSPLRSIDF